MLEIFPRKSHGAAMTFSGRPLAHDDPGPIPTEPQIGEPRPFRRSTPRPVTRVSYDGPSPLDDARPFPDIGRLRTHEAIVFHVLAGGSLTDELIGTGHSCLDCRTAYGLEQRVSPWPLIAYALVLIAIGLALGILASSGLASTPHTATGRGPSLAAAADPIEARPVRASALLSPEAMPVPTTSESPALQAAPAARAHLNLDTTRYGFVAYPRAAEVAKAASLDAGPNLSANDAAKPSSGGGDRAVPAPRAVIAAAAARYGLDAAYLIAIATCESSLDEFAVGRAQELGVFQWKPTSWQLASRLSGRSYGIERIFDVDAQADLAAWAISSGYASWWSCAS